MPIDIDVTTSYLYKLGAKEERKKIKKEMKEEIKEMQVEVKKAKEEVKEAKEEVKRQRDHAILQAVNLKILTFDQIAQMFDIPTSYIQKLVEENEDSNT